MQCLKHRNQTPGLGTLCTDATDKGWLWPVTAPLCVLVSSLSITPGQERETEGAHVYLAETTLTHHENLQCGLSLLGFSHGTLDTGVICLVSALAPRSSTRKLQRTRPSHSTKSQALEEVCPGQSRATVTSDSIIQHVLHSRQTFENICHVFC